MMYLDIQDTTTDDGVLLRDSVDDRVIARGHLTGLGAGEADPGSKVELPVKFIGVAVDR